jgi:hypothetical protein
MKFDKIEFSCLCSREFLILCKNYSLKNFEQVIDGSGKYGYKKSLLSSLVQVFFTPLDDDNFECFVSIGSYLSNNYGFYLVKRLFMSGLISNVRITRLDFCYDLIGDEAEKFKISKFKLNKLPKGSTPELKIFFNKVNPSLIDTSYFKSYYFLIRVYDKGVEQRLSPYNSIWKRFEIQINKNFIRRYWSDGYFDLTQPVSDWNDTFKLWIGHIRDNYSFQGRYNEIIKKMSLDVDFGLKRLKKTNDITKHLNYVERVFGVTIDFMVLQKQEKYQRLFESPELQKAVVGRFFDKFNIAF